MGSGASLALPDEYEKLSDDEKVSFQNKFELRLQRENQGSNTAAPEAVVQALYRETLELIAKMPNDGGGKHDVESAKAKLAEFAKQEAANKFAFEAGKPTKIKLTELEMAIDHALAGNLTPLIVDNSDDQKVDTYFSYGSGVLLDSKKLGLDRTMRKVPLAVLMDEARGKLVNALKYGNRLVIAMTKSVTDFTGVFTDESEQCQLPGNSVDFSDGKMFFPLEVFNNAGRALVQEKYLEALFRDQDRENGIAFSREPGNFAVICTSAFSPEDFEDFLFGNEYGMPKPVDKYAFIVVEGEEG